MGGALLHCTNIGMGYRLHIMNNPRVIDVRMSLVYHHLV